MSTPAHATSSDSACVQRTIRVSGVVQGVGFRPYVWRLANGLGLTGWVRNDAAGVEILVQGERLRIEIFTRRLLAEIPPLARVRELKWTDAAAAELRQSFAVAKSGAGKAATMIGHDSAVCLECLTEMFDPADRRWRYAFINCTRCGPRYTLTRRLPYDRAQTSMEAFSLCADCEREYRDPADRRFHAEPTACPACGPALRFEPLTHYAPRIARNADPVAETLNRLRAGEIVAVKGLGGFHLACDARNAEAVRRLRLRKNREEKPFALMAANAASIFEWVETGAAERALLESPERPIVLLRKRSAADELFPDIAPGLAWLGIMLPYTPLHWLLFHEAAGRPAGTSWMKDAQELALVMTSANPGGEPLVIDNEEAVERLAGIAHAALTHDREIVVRCDDSVVRSNEARVPQFLRRARGYTPRAIRLPRSGPSVLALGAYFKNTICVTRNDEAYVSQHIGGLDNPASCSMLVEVTDHLLSILEVKPEIIAHDLHPDFFSTRRARELAEKWGVPAVGVQHHHAHIAAVAAEHGVTGPVLGLAMDGIGLGSDRSAWGGELLRVEDARFHRLGHLAPIVLPGGDRAATEPWRMAAAVLHDLGRGREIAGRFPGQAAAGRIHELLARGLNCPSTTSLGRWFDAAAGLLGVREVMAYEGQAAMLLEGLAERAGPVAPLSHGYELRADGALDLLPLLARLADESDASFGAALFHATLAHALAEWTIRGARETCLNTVALGGGCFLNQILSRELTRLLVGQGFEVLAASQVPPNDGGLSLGQAWVAVQHLH